MRSKDSGVREIVNALSRNFDNIGNHLEQMSYDLTSDVTGDFENNSKKTKKLISNLKNELVKRYFFLLEIVKRRLERPENWLLIQGRIMLNY